MYAFDPDPTERLIPRKNPYFYMPIGFTEDCSDMLYDMVRLLDGKAKVPGDLTPSVFPLVVPFRCPRAKSLIGYMSIRLASPGEGSFYG